MLLSSWGWKVIWRFELLHFWLDPACLELLSTSNRGWRTCMIPQSASSYTVEGCSSLGWRFIAWTLFANFWQLDGKTFVLKFDWTVLPDTCSLSLLKFQVSFQVVLKRLEVFEGSTLIVFEGSLISWRWSLDCLRSPRFYRFDYGLYSFDVICIDQEIICKSEAVVVSVKRFNQIVDK